MDIILVKDKDNELSDVFNAYDNYAKRIFETSGIEQEEYIAKYRELKTKINKWLLVKTNISDSIKFSEYDYEEGIKGIVVRNLLSNGLYLKEEIEDIFNKHFDEVEESIKEKFKIFYREYTGNILIWNTDIEG